MRLQLQRKFLTPKSTTGELKIDGVFNCFILEPPKGESIPDGIFKVVKTWSPKFNKMMYLLEGVPGFEGVRIHPGNQPIDTEGCLLPGLSRADDLVLHSMVATDTLYKILDASDSPITIEISN